MVSIDRTLRLLKKEVEVVHAFELVNLMRDEDCCPNICTYNLVIDG